MLQVGGLLDPARRPAAALLRAWPTLSDVAGAVRDAGARVSVLHAGWRDETVRHDDIDYRFVAEPRPLRLSPRHVLPLRLARAAARLRPDAIHLNGLHFPLLARALRHALPGTPLLLQHHAEQPPHRFRRLHGWGLRAADGLAFTAREQAEPFLALAGRPDLPVFEIPESSSRFRPGDREQARAELGVSGDPALLWIGRLEANKDPLTILEAVARAAERLPELTLWMCFTESPLLDAVRERIAADARLRERVRLLGRLPHERVETLCRAGDFLLLGSAREACCYSVLEALACGVTPILSDIPPFRAVTGRGAVGRLVPRGDAGAFAEAIVALAAQDRAAQRAAVRAHFDAALAFPVVGAALVDAYRVLRR